MSTFADFQVNARFPARYQDAQELLRFRVVDVTEDEAPDLLVTTEIGDGLVAALIWDRIAVTASTLQTWGVSVDVAIATAIANVDAMEVKEKVRDAGDARITFKSGNPWASSLAVAEARGNDSEDGFLMAIPHGSVMATTAVTGAETITGLEVLMELCDELYELDGSGVSPFVWWWFQDSYRRVTNRMHDGSIDFTSSSNVCAFYLARAIEHLANPCAECGWA